MTIDQLTIIDQIAHKRMRRVVEASIALRLCDSGDSAHRMHVALIRWRSAVDDYLASAREQP